MGLLEASAEIMVFIATLLFAIAILGAVALLCLIVWVSTRQVLRSRRDIDVRPMPGEIWDDRGVPMEVIELTPDGLIFRRGRDIVDESWAEFEMARRKNYRWRRRSNEDSQGGGNSILH